MWKSNVKNILTFACQSEIKQRGYFEEFPDCAITYHTCPHHSRRPERQNIIDRMHTWQQCSVTLSEDILTTKYGFNLKEISSLSIDNNTNISDAHAWIGPRNHQVGTLLKRHTLVPSPPPPLDSVAWCKRCRGNSLKCYCANFSARGSQSGGIPARGTWRHMPYVYCAKNSTDGIPILENEHGKGKCTLFYCCFGHYRMLTYKISACEVCMIWRKPTEAFQNPLPIAESRTVKPAMVTLKIQLHCSMVHDTSPLANIYVRSHLRYGTDSVFYGGPEGTSLHKFFIALHKFWLVWKKYYVIMYT